MLMVKILHNIQKALNAKQEEINALNEAMLHEKLVKNELFLKEGDSCGKLAFIEKGSMRLFYDSPDKQVCNDFYFENSLIGSIAGFLSGEPSRISIAAIEPCHLLVIMKEDVLRLIDSYPSLRHLAQIILQEYLSKAEKREASLLKYSPEDRFLNLMEEHPKIFKRIPLHFVASYLNISPETLSRYRNKFSV
jgi:CRP-like cAMP-binding protein